MSDHNHVLELSEEAYNDLIDIQNYTYAQHGENQWKSYSCDLDDGMAHIIAYPFSGHQRGDVPKGYLTWKVRKHVMIYRIKGTTVYLVRVLHGKMDFRLRFSKKT